MGDLLQWPKREEETADYVSGLANFYVQTALIYSQRPAPEWANLRPSPYLNEDGTSDFPEYNPPDDAA